MSLGRWLALLEIKMLEKLFYKIGDAIYSFGEMLSNLIISKRSENYHRWYKPSNECRICGRKYLNPDEAAICGDWDLTLGRK